MRLSALALGVVVTLGLTATNSFAQPVAQTAAQTVDPAVNLVTVTIDSTFASGKAKDYGVKEVANLAEDLRKTVEKQLIAKGRFKADDPKAAVIHLVLVDAKPNRPTFKQMSDKPGLSMQSFGVGGAEIRGEQINPDGSHIQLGYSWYETDIRWAQSLSTWSNAEQAFHGLARRVAEGHADVVPK